MRPTTRFVTSALVLISLITQVIGQNIPSCSRTDDKFLMLACQTSVFTERFRPFWGSEMRDCRANPFPSNTLSPDHPWVFFRRWSMKLRTDVPDPSIVKDVKLNYFASSDDLPIRRDRPTTWNEQLRFSICSQEQRAVRVVGELVWANRWGDGTDYGMPGCAIQGDKFDPWCVGDNRSDVSDGDWHLEIREPSELPWAETRKQHMHVVAEITPYFLFNYPALFDAPRLARRVGQNDYSRRGATVRITGWLFQDDHYPTDNDSTPHDGRNSSWEIHPVTDFEIWSATENRWISCAKLPQFMSPGERSACLYHKY